MNSVERTESEELIQKSFSKKSMFNVIIGKKREECDSGRWTDAEHEKFLDLIISTKTLNWKKFEKIIQTRSNSQIRSHFQKYIKKVCDKYNLKRNLNEILLNDSPSIIQSEERKVVEIYNSYKTRRLRLRKKRLEIIYEKNLKKKKFFRINKKEDKKVIFSCSTLSFEKIPTVKNESQLYTNSNADNVPSFTNFTKNLSLKTNCENPGLDKALTTMDNSPSNTVSPNISNETLCIYNQIEYFYNLNKVYLNLIRIPTYNYDVILGHLKEYVSYAKNYSNKTKY